MHFYKTAEVSTPSDREVKVTRSFNASRDLVYRAFTEPSLITRWMLGPPGWTMPVCEMDLREGGAYRWRWRAEEDAKEFGFEGEFTKIQPNALIAYTQIFDPGDVGGAMSENVARIRTEFVEADGKTTVTTIIDFGSKEARDAAISTGMTDGMEMSYQALEKVLAGKACSQESASSISRTRAASSLPSGSKARRRRQ